VHFDLTVGKLEIKFNGYAFSASKTESNVGYIMSKKTAPNLEDPIISLDQVNLGISISGLLIDHRVF